MLLHLQKWAHAYRDSRYYGAVDTNNGVEALNKVLKYGYLPKKNSLTLSGIATLLVKNYLLDMYQKYIFQNYKLSGEYRAYSPSVPSYLHGRPHSVITHCLHRKAKANKYTTEDVTKVDDGVFQVTKPKGGSHTVTFCSDSGSPSCTCKDWKRHHIPCKHFFCVFNFYPDNWDWSTLPKCYLESAYLSRDEGALESYFGSSSGQDGMQSLSVETSPIIDSDDLPSGTPSSSSEIMPVNETTEDRMSAHFQKVCLLVTKNCI